MNSSIATFTKLLLTFVSSFGVAFAGITIAMSNQTGIDLDWSILANDIKGIHQKIAYEAEEQIQNIAVGFQSLAEEKPTKVMIYSAPENSSELLSENDKNNSRSYLTDQMIFDTAENSDQNQLAHFQGKIIRPGEISAKNISSENKSVEILAKQEEVSGLITDTNLEAFVYYNQHDPQWKDYLYGGYDPIDKYGCGPTALAMLLANTSKKEMTPEKAADWAAEKGYFALHSGSYHGIIRDGANAFGLDSTAFSDYSEQSIREQLEQGHLFVALMKKGTFSTSSGHFLLILGLDENGRAIIADSNSVANTQKTWALSDLIAELKYGANDGGPLWIVRMK